MVWGILVITIAAAAQQPSPMSDAELSQHLGAIRGQLANSAIDLGRREGLRRTWPRRSIRGAGGRRSRVASPARARRST